MKMINPDSLEIDFTKLLYIRHSNPFNFDFEKIF